MHDALHFTTKVLCTSTILISLASVQIGRDQLTWRPWGSLHTYKTCWSIIKADVMAAVSTVWSRNFNNLARLNTAYITMIPKHEGADQVKDFRPISLVHSFAKLLTKILANRLASRLQAMISPKAGSYKTTLCWSNKLQDFYINIRWPVCCSSLT